MQWFSASNDPRIAVHGLPFHAENQGRFLRLPLRAEGVVRPEVWGLAKQTSGGRVRFRSNTTTRTSRSITT